MGRRLCTTWVCYEICPARVTSGESCPRYVVVNGPIRDTYSLMSDDPTSSPTGVVPRTEGSVGSGGDVTVSGSLDVSSPKEERLFWGVPRGSRSRSNKEIGRS